MTVKQCDRCGAIFPSKDYLENEGGFRMYFTDENKPEGVGNSQYDLCPKCAKLFYDFMRADKENGKAIEEKRADNG